MADKQRGLFDSDEDLAAYLARMTSAPEPFTAQHDFSLGPDASARFGLQFQPQGTGTGRGASPPSATPSGQLNLGPLSLSGGLTLAQTIDDAGNRSSSMTPNFGAGMRVPLGGGEAEAGFTLTPSQLLQLDAEYRRKLLGGDLSVRGNYGQPLQGGDPSWGMSARYSRSF